MPSICSDQPNKRTTLLPPFPAGTAAAAHFGHVDAVSWVTGVLGAFLAFQVTGC